MGTDAKPPEQPAHGDGPYRRAKLVPPPRHRAQRPAMALSVVGALGGLLASVTLLRSAAKVPSVPLRELIGAPATPPVPSFSPLQSVDRLALIEGSPCALTSAGAVYCWGGQPPHTVRGCSVATRRLLSGDAHARAFGPRDEVLVLGDLRRSRVHRGGSSVSPREEHKLHHLYRLEADGRVRFLADDAQPDGHGQRHAEGFVDGLPRSRAIVDGLCAIGYRAAWCWRDRPSLWHPDAPDPPDLAFRPIRVEGAFEAISISSHQGQNLCASSARGEVWCWSATHNEYPDRVVASRVLGISNATRAFALSYGACGQHPDGRLSCTEIRTALRESGPLPHLERARVMPGVRDPVDLVESHNEVCALTRERRVVCWGEVRGTGALASRPHPAAVPGLRDVVGLAVGEAHACALGRDGRVRCWGRRLEPSFTLEAHAPAPTVVSGLSDVVQIHASGNDNCAVRRDGAVLCWGASPPVQFGFPGFASEVLVRSHAACARTRDGQVWCYPLTTRPADTISPTPRLVEMPPARSLLGLDERACARDAAGAVRCWTFPWNSLDQAYAEMPWTVVPNITPSPDVVALDARSLRWDPNEPVWPVVLARRWSAPRFGGLGGLASLATDGERICGASVDGTVHCHITSPPEGLRGVRELGLGRGFGCALHENGTVSCWGDNGFGQLGVQGIYHAPPAEVVVEPDV